MKFDLRKGFDSIKQPHVDYYRQYTYDQPMVMSVAQYEDTRALGLVLAKALRHMMDHFEDYLDILPRPPRDLEILQLHKSQPQYIGTFRTDFVIDEAGQIKIIEITTRQPLNGYFSSGFFSADRAG